jgi:peptidoglycan L-alanyl-D-glutamate endopeptidase CwlK
MIRAPNALALPTMQGAVPVVFNERSMDYLAPLDPRLRELMLETERIASERGIDFEISEGMRDPERQAELVASGASQTMNSRHLHGNAADIHILNPDGSINWDFEAYRPIADIAKSVAADMGITDFVWGGDWESLRDGVHLQVGGPSSGAPPAGRGGNAQPAPTTWAGGTPFDPSNPPPNNPPNALAAQQEALALAQLRQREGYRNALMESLRTPLYTNQLQGVAR